MKRPDSQRVLITDFFAASNGSSTVKKARKVVKVEETKPETAVKNDLKQVTVEEVTEKENKDPQLTELNQAIKEKTHESQNPQSNGNVTEQSNDYTQYCKIHNFDKQKWVESLSSEQRELLDLEIKHLHISWLVFLHGEIVKPYFLKLKRFLKLQESKEVFPPANQIYSWSHYTPLPNIKCLVLGQDPYHNNNQAHGLAFSVLEPTKPPPSLVNIYKTLKIDFPDFKIPDYKELAKQGRPGGGNLTKWAQRGVLMLNAVLTVEAHKANSHAKQGWETFTEKVIEVALTYHLKGSGFVVMAWGSPAQQRIAKFNRLLDNFLILKAVHPSPLSAHRGFFELKVFKNCNDWLEQRQLHTIDWTL